ncbi:MAG TPA: LysM peptidoglycan-binding domain-containing protein [Caldilineaceae bacterium]|nr:LysM peptidoglycan-binding domain-containing protein [Caldilineaceae bacterium]
MQAQTVASPTHTVQAGESLSEIAVRYGLSLDELMALNSIDDPDAIFAGQILVLPTAAPPAPPPLAVDPAYRPDEPPATHIVQPGDTLTAIARAYGMDPAELMALNGIADPNTIIIGQALRLSPAVATGEAQDAPAPPMTGSGNPIASLNPVYTVAPGDTLARIALQMEVDETALRRLNRLETGAPLAVGQTLILPATRRELAPPAPASPEEDSIEYTVAPGDSLSAIAQAHGLSLAELMEANAIENADAIYVGQRLLLPPPAAAASEDEEPQMPIQIGRPRSGYFYYTVKPGDTLSELARDFDSTILAILEYNDLPDQETVYLGRTLRIPYGPPPLPLDGPPAPLSGTRFLVSLSRQQCWVFQGERVRHAWTCSTGYGEWITRTGTFAVQTKLELAKSTAYELDMPYWLGIYDVGAYENGIHGLPVRWDTGEKIWTGLIGQPATFGCAMLDDDDAATLFELAYLGMPVHIVP